MILAKDIREQFLSFFEKHGHTRVRSSSLIPKDDPTLLFTNAGMVQFKQAFLGQESRPYFRATTSQKCLRVGGKHNDLENVGRTARHHTFFEMLGNFSFGDYFKEDAIVFAWAFLTKNLGLPKDRLYATVFRDDDEAMGLWKKIAGLPESRIFRLGEKDNFWSMGDTGPCGPCSEIMVDQGEAMSCGPNCGIGQCDCDRFLEVWNLVFMQFNRDESGVMTPLPKPSIDTGMGLERIAAVCQGVHSNFDGDLFRGLIGRMEGLANVAYGRSAETDVALRVIADHSRSVAFLIADGILPSNEGRGYVLRRLIRRAFRFGRLIGLNDPFLHRICGEVVSQMGGSFPELTESASFLDRVVSQEEERFSETLDKGLALLEGELKTLRGKGQKRISGEVAFKLYDTFGFPLDIVNDIAEKQGFTVDEPGFKDCMAGQKKQSKEAWSGSGEKDVAGQFSALLKSGVTSRFIGYEFLNGQGIILALIDQSGEATDRLVKGQSGYLVAAATPFYGESGGQAGDKGRAQTPSGQSEITTTLKPSAKLTVHAVTVTMGELRVSEEANLTVDEGLRVATARNHTCTHLLHAALRRVLGTHVKQAGSFVTPTRLRFDFSHIAAMSLDELRAVEEDVNRAILAGLPVQTQVLNYDQAVAKGAMALFGEKYEDEVRVVEVPGVSSELCGGTHLADTGRAGSFCILSESGVAAGVRRIEGLTGWEALNYWRERRDAVQESLTLVKGQASELPRKVAELQDQIKVLTKEKKGLEDKLVSGAGKDYLSGVENVGEVKLLCAQVDGADARALRTLMDDLRSKLASGIICLASGVDGKAALIISVSKDLHGRFTAPALIKDVSKEIGGSGGGRPDMAQAGGTDPKGISKAFTTLKSLIA